MDVIWLAKSIRFLFVLKRIYLGQFRLRVAADTVRLDICVLGGLCQHLAVAPLLLRRRHLLSLTLVWGLASVVFDPWLHLGLTRVRLHHVRIILLLHLQLVCICQVGAVGHLVIILEQGLTHLVGWQVAHWVHRLQVFWSSEFNWLFYAFAVFQMTGSPARMNLLVLGRLVMLAVMVTLRRHVVPMQRWSPRVIL